MPLAHVYQKRAEAKEEAFQLLAFIFASQILHSVQAWWELSFPVGVLDGKAFGKCLTWLSTYVGEILKQSCGKWEKIKGCKGFCNSLKLFKCRPW